MQTKGLRRLIFISIIILLIISGCDVNEESDDLETQPEVLETAIEGDYDVIIVGAGISGLTAGYFLEDYDIKILEKEDQVGGRVVSGSYAGFSYALGTEYLGEPYGPLKKIINALDVELREIPSPMDAHYHDGTFYYGEEGLALMFIENSSLEEFNHFVLETMKIYNEYDEIPQTYLDSDLNELDNLTMSAWLDKGEYSDIYYDAWNTAARGLFGANIDEISALSYISEIAFEYEGFKPLDEDDVAELENSPEKNLEHSESYTFTKGITEITKAITDHLGDRVQLNSTVTDVIWDNDNDIYQVTYQDNSERSHVLYADAVILAVPAPIALKLAPEELSDEQVSIMEQVSYAGYITAALFSEEPVWSQAFDLAVPEDYFFTDIYDSTWVQRSYDPSLAEKPESVMGIYVAPEGYQDWSIMNMAEDELLENIYIDLEKIFPGVREKIIGHDIYHHYYAYPVMTPGAYGRLLRLHEITGDGLFLAGDYMIYPTFEAAADSGYLAAEKVEDFLDQ